MFAKCPHRLFQLRNWDEYKESHVYRPQAKFREGNVFNVFTGVCDSVHRGGAAWSRRVLVQGVPGPGGAEGG